MLGNFSFGDYFKDRAIELAWNLLTKEWGISPDRLTATVYHTDDEAFDLWKRISGLPESRIIRIPTKDNFWAMGDDGPSGPCSEIFFDHGDHIPGGPPGSPDEDGDRFVEIWNLVFMQFEQAAGEIVSELPKKSIDTGMGLERLAAVLQGVHDNYDTDTFKALIRASQELTSNNAADSVASHRIIADHLRTSGFLVADGVLPANEGRGYVLRRKRHASVRRWRTGYAFSTMRRPSCRMAARSPVRPRSSSTTPTASPTTSQRTRCAPAGSRWTVRVSTPRWRCRRLRPARRGRAPASRRPTNFGSTAIVKDGKRVENAEIGQTVELLLNQTPFYGESGGQIGDTGKLTTLKGFLGEVEDTSKPLGKLHVLRTKVVAGELTVGETVHQKVDSERRDRVRANHSATHLLHAALRHRLGTHVTQKGSLVAPDYFRFDFSHPKALSREEIEQIEADVNAQIRGNEEVTTRLMTPDEAIGAGAMALFGEKYGDEVRVLSMGRMPEADYSVELCGGTHVRALGDIQLFKIISESAVSSGVRRIEALTGEAARQWLTERDSKLREAAATLKASPDEVPARVASLVEERRRLERELADAKKALAMGGGAATADAAGPEDVNGHKFLGQVVEGLNPKDLRSTVDTMKQRVGSGIAALVAVNDGRASVAVGVTDDLAGQVSAVDLVKVAVATLGGQGGGGRPDMAQGGGPDGSKAKEALDAVRDALERVAA
jgi:alanyl-tRNA synthetase